MTDGGLAAGPSRAASDSAAAALLALESAPSGVLLTDPHQPDNPIVMVNRAFEAITGYPAGEVIGRNCRFLQGPDTDLGSIRRMREAIASGETFAETILNYRRDGSTFWNAVRIAPIRDAQGKVTHFVGVTDDVTAVRLTEAKLRAVVEAAPIGVAAIDTGGLISLWNPAAERLLGWSAAEMMGQPSPVPGTAQQVVIDGIVEAVLSGQTLTDVEVVAPTRDQGSLTVSLSAAPIRDPGGRPVGVVGLFSDLSARRRLEQQLRQAQKMDALGHLAGGIAHDFNNLLTAIGGFSDLAEVTAEPADFEQIRKSVGRASNLTRQLLALARRQVLEPTVLDVGELVADMAPMLDRLLGDDIVLVTDHELDPSLVSADAGQIQQVLLNLSVNARDAMPDGGTLSITTSNVVLDASYASAHAELVPPGQYVLLTVVDSGRGMDESTLSRVFEPYFTTKDDTGQSYGLGLAVVHGIVTQSGGFIWIYSEPGRGTTFKVYLPRVFGAAAVRGAMGEPVRGGTETILLVEDDPTVRAFAARTLRALGYDVHEAANGEDGLALADHVPSIDLLLTDVAMPVLGGVDLARQLGIARPGLRTLFVSGFAAERLDNAIEPGGRQTFLSKPYTTADLAATVRRVLEAAPAA